MYAAMSLRNHLGSPINRVAGENILRSGEYAQLARVELEFAIELCVKTFTSLFGMQQALLRAREDCTFSVRRMPKDCPGVQKARDWSMARVFNFDSGARMGVLAPLNDYFVRKFPGEKC